MVTREVFVDILSRYKQGTSIRQLARELNVSRNTVRKYLKEGTQYPKYNLNRAKPSLLDPFKDYLQQRIMAAKPEWIPATVLLKEIRLKGYTGEISILRRYIRQFKSLVKPDPLVRFETPQGKQLQIDFITIKNGKSHFKAFVGTLGYSRASYVEFFDNEKTESWISGLRNTFQYFGGVTEEVLCDNAKALVIERDCYGEGKHRFNSLFLDLAKMYGFTIKACKPYRAKTKGKVERFNSYVKHSFIIPLLSLLRPLDINVTIEILNAKVKTWLLEEANKRTHGTTGQCPCILLEEEQKFLMKLPELAPPPVSVKKKKMEAVVEPSKHQSPKIQPSPSVFDVLLNKFEVA